MMPMICSFLAYLTILSLKRWRSQRVKYRVPTAQGKQGKWPKKNPCQGKHREFGNFPKTQGIWFAQVVNSLILKVKDILKFAVKISKKNLSLISLPSQFCLVIVTNHVICTGKICRRTGEKQRNHREFENAI